MTLCLVNGRDGRDGRDWLLTSGDRLGTGLCDRVC